MKNRGTMDFILVLIGAFLLLFTIAMTWIFLLYETIPDTLVSCVFMVLGGECGAMAWIKTAKEKNKEREWEKEDRKENVEQSEDEFIPESDEDLFT